MSLIRLHPSGQEVECKAGETILAALENAGYAVPNNCRAGACGECKTFVRSGEFDQGIILDMALNRDERSAGYGLLCMAKPLSDVIEIDFGTADAKPKLFPPRENLAFVVTERIPRTASIVELRLRPLGDPLRYWPGQYVVLGDDSAGVAPRPYSIANAPRPDGEITLQIARVEHGTTSRWVHEKLRPGDQVRVSGPYGTFIGDPSVDTPVLCLAAGSGLAPILALADAALRRGFHHPVDLLFSAETSADVYDQGLLAYWEAKYPNFRFLRTLTREPGDPPVGRIPEILADLFPDLSAYSVFIAGNPGFVDSCEAAVKALGAKPAQIHTEGYFERQSPEAPPAERLLGQDRRAG